MNQDFEKELRRAEREKEHARRVESFWDAFRLTENGHVKSTLLLNSFCLSILKSADGDPACSHRYFYEYDAPLAGEGRFIHTYQENAEPLPSFEGEPRRVSVSAPDAETLASQVWASLNEDNKVSLFVQYIHLATGERETVILNKHGEQAHAASKVPN